MAGERLGEREQIMLLWAKGRLGERETVEWAATALKQIRGSFGLANEDVRGSAAWQFAHLFHVREVAKDENAKDNRKDENDYSAEALWERLGKSFFAEIWPLEPGLQSAASANDFARIPVGVGQRYFKEAVETVLPYLQPFEVWAVITEFQLDRNKPSAKELVQSFPHEILILLAICISPNQQHGVYDLKPILEWITEARPDLKQDYRMRALRNLAR